MENWWVRFWIVGSLLWIGGWLMSYHDDISYMLGLPLIAGSYVLAKRWKLV